MNSTALISIAPGYFTSKAEALTEIARDDLWPVTVHQGGFPAAPLHCHDAAVRIYVLVGAFLVDDGSGRPAVAAGPGTRVIIPAGATHTVSATAPVVTITAFASSADSAGLPQLPVRSSPKP